MSGKTNLVKKEPMLFVSIFAALISMLITKPSADLIRAIDWKTLATLFMLLNVLEGFKKENLFMPVIKLICRLNELSVIGFFLVFSVFLSSMFVTNDVSLIIFVPLTIMIYRASDRENFILPLIVMENIAAVRGSLLTPFGSPQNLFLFSKSQIGAKAFLSMMFPIWITSAVLIALFILFIFRKNPKERAVFDDKLLNTVWNKQHKFIRLLYLFLFCCVICCIVSRTEYWAFVTLGVTLLLLIFDREIFARVDYVLLVTFLCFFIFSSSISANPTIKDFLSRSVAHHEYVWAIGLSQIISNVPASIVLWPFSTDLKALIYGLDTAGLIWIIGSLASVINLRIYLKDYPRKIRGIHPQLRKIRTRIFRLRRGNSVSDSEITIQPVSSW